jgi:hypothetical protein
MSIPASARVARGHAFPVGGFYYCANMLVERAIQGPTALPVGSFEHSTRSCLTSSTNK